MANACETFYLAVNLHGPIGRTDAKIYVSRGRNVLSEILQKYHFCTLFHFVPYLSYKLLAAAGRLN